MEETVFVSGLYSGPSPSAGLGVARALRAAFPSVKLTGVDYWAGSSGLHHEVFDRTWLKPSWDLIEEDLYAREIQAELDEGAFWIPTLDLEVAWLARTLRPHGRLLAPNEAALASTRKPRPAIAEMLPFGIPPSLDLAESDEKIYSFCRAHSWRVWVKGPYHEAVFVATWRMLEDVRAWMRRRWQTDRLVVQTHVGGFEESIALAAVAGRLADAIYMRKRIITADGKTWAGRVAEVPSDILSAVEAAVRSLGWTGGAEIELIRDVDGHLWFLEWNPRFPAWVYGAALAGRNLPAALVRSALGIAQPPRSLFSRTEFTRVVVEVPVRTDLPLPLTAEPEHGYGNTSGKYAAGLGAIMPMLAVDDSRTGLPAALPTLSPETEADLCAAAAMAVETPYRLFLRQTAEVAFARLETGVAMDGVRLHYAYSLKTCPDADYLALARKAGMLAECISQLEVRRAVESGWPPAEIVLNGPGKWWPETEPPVDGLRAVFCDSLEELERLAVSGRSDRLWGVRLRIPDFPSRFGVPIEDPATFERLCAAIAALPKSQALGIHLHMASTWIGIGHWRDAAESAIVWAKIIESATGHPVSVLDLGGGYHPDDFACIPFKDIARFARKNLPGLQEVYVEPGRALTQATMAVLTRVLDVRRSCGKLREVVVDTCIADLPLVTVYPHRVFRIADRRPLPVGRGPVRVLGRICMEDDVLFVGLDLPETLSVGDCLVVCDAGAYERSMSYAFGRAGYL
jgi:diaminopimelate decarboxylase